MKTNKLYILQITMIFCLHVFLCPTQASLVAHFDFEEGSGGTTVDSIAGLSGSISGATFTSDSKNGGTALSFDGNDSVVIGHSSILTPANLGLALWVKINPSQPASFFDILDKDHDSTSNYVIQGLVGSSLGIAPAGASVSNFSSVLLPDGSTVNLADNEYHHLAFNIGPDGRQMYVDGQLVVNNPGQAINYVGTPSLFLGRHAHCCGGRFFRGTMDDLRFFDAQISAQEVALLAGVVPEPSTISLAFFSILGIAFFRRKFNH